jgi:hypothetical protein
VSGHGTFHHTHTNKATGMRILSRRQNQRSPIIGGLCMPINRNLAGFTSSIPISPTVGRCNFFSIVAFLTTPRPVALLTIARPQQHLIEALRIPSKSGHASPNSIFNNLLLSFSPSAMRPQIYCSLCGAPMLESDDW